MLTSVNGKVKQRCSHILWMHGLSWPEKSIPIRTKTKKIPIIEFLLLCLIWTLPSRPWFIYVSSMEKTFRLHRYSKQMYQWRLFVNGSVWRQNPFWSVFRWTKWKRLNKTVSSTVKSSEIKDIFNTNVVTYFPSYRYEVPNYLNDPYNVKLSFNTRNRFSNELPNPIEVITGINGLVNWIMDIVIDGELYKRTQVIDGKILTSLRKTKYGKVYSEF